MNYVYLIELTIIVFSIIGYFILPLNKECFLYYLLSYIIMNYFFFCIRDTNLLSTSQCEFPF